jgi:hypothetical protein
MKADEFIKLHLMDNVTQPNPEHYEFVTEVIAKNHEEVFKQFQDIDNPLKTTIHIDYRSMTVGDILIDEYGKGYLCRPLGWQEFDPTLSGFALSGK